MDFLIDTHYHLTEPPCYQNAGQILENLSACGIRTVIVPTFSRDSILRLKSLKKTYPDLPAAWGIHPLFIPGSPPLLINLIETHNTVAIGEIGLDGRAGPKADESQEAVFRDQMKIAAENNLPVLIHCVNRHDRIAAILRDFPAAKGVIHRVSCSRRQAEQYLDLGFNLGFGPDICESRFRKMRDLAQWVPVESILFESDAPFFSSYPMEPDRPADLGPVLKTMANLRKTDPEELESIVMQNTITLFDRLELTA
ncbi:TatD family hydrolase [bacterium]|nr:TatD family hydrolase [candidate division CSSED10-310 bacterium]